MPNVRREYLGGAVRGKHFAGAACMGEDGGRLHVADFAADDDAAETGVAGEHAVDVCDAVGEGNGG